jgi:hypothetical protein
MMEVDGSSMLTVKKCMRHMWLENSMIDEAVCLEDERLTETSKSPARLSIS